MSIDIDTENFFFLHKPSNIPEKRTKSKKLLEYYNSKKEVFEKTEQIVSINFDELSNIPIEIPNDPNDFNDEKSERFIYTGNVSNLAMVKHKNRHNFEFSSFKKGLFTILLSSQFSKSENWSNYIQLFVDGLKSYMHL